MLTFIELLIGVMVIVGVARYIIKGYSATGVLFVGGLVLLIISALMGHKVLPASETSTGYTATDIVEYIKILLMSRGGDLGMMIMMLCGFAAYMTHIGANDMVVKLASKPLQYINSPYLLMIAAYFVACLMSLAVSSATGLGVLLMATLFPVMVNVGISRGAAAAICASPAAIILSPTSGDVVLAAKAAEMPLIDFAFKTTLPISIAAIIGMAIAHFFWQRYLDKKENISHEMLDVNEITTTAPAFYAILPFCHSHRLSAFWFLMVNGVRSCTLLLFSSSVCCSLPCWSSFADSIHRKSFPVWKSRTAGWLTHLRA